MFKGLGVGIQPGNRSRPEFKRPPPKRLAVLSERVPPRTTSALTKPLKIAPPTRAELPMSRLSRTVSVPP